VSAKALTAVEGQLQTLNFSRRPYT